MTQLMSRVFNTALSEIPLILRDEIFGEAPEFIFGSPKIIFYIELVFLVLLLIYGAKLLLRSKAQESMQMMFENLPSRIGVVNFGGRVLFSHVPHGDSITTFLQKTEHISKLPEEIKEPFAKAIKETFETENKVELNYNFEGRRRHASFVLLPRKNPFHAKTVMWVSSDTELERKQQDTEFMFQNVLDNLPCSVFVKDIDNDFRYIVANKFYAKQINHNAEDIVGKKVHDILPAVDAEQSVALDNAAMLNGASEGVIKFTNRAGIVHYVKDFRKILVMPDGKTILLGVNADITELTKQQQQLEISNGILQKILDNLPAMISVKDSANDFRYIIWNKTAERITGISAAEALGKNDAELPWHDSAESLRKQDIEAGSGETIKLARRINSNGNKYDMQVLVTSIKQTQNVDPMIIFMGMDVTEEKRLEAERVELMENLKLYTERARLLNTWLEDALLDVSDDFVFRKMLKTVEEKMGADDVHIFQIDYDRKTFVPKNDWSFKVPDYLMAGPVPVFDENTPWYQKLLNHEILEVAELTDQNVQDIFYGEHSENTAKNRLSSLYLIGIWNNHQLWGCLVSTFKTPKIVLSNFEQRIFESATHIVEILLERRENRNKQSRAEYERQLIMDSIKVPIMLFDPDLKLVFCNNAAMKVSSNPSEEIYQHDCWDSFCGEPCRPANCPVEKCKLDGKEHSKDLHIRGRDYILYAYPIYIEGKLINIIKTMHDVTEFNEAQKQLSAALLDAQNANKAKNFFLATISHELRTPLNSVIGFSELLQKKDLPKRERQEYLQSINLAGNSLLNLINDVLDLSKNEAGQVVLSNKPTDVRRILKEIYAIFQHRIQKKNLEFILDCPHDLPLLKIDNLRLRQIALNLTGNAVKFTQKGEIKIGVMFKRNNEQTGVLTINVCDTGVGIKSDALEKIFQPFVQQDAVRDSSNGHGTGLGLTICKSLAKIMGGNIRVESEEHKGSCFTLELLDVEYSKRIPTAELPKPKLKVLKPLEILIVDDVPMNLKVLSTMLTSLGMTVVSATSGKEALEILESQIPDLILTDFWMPEMNGEELSRHIRENPKTAHLKIVAVTADTENQDNFSQEYFESVLLKPVTLEKLGNLLSEL